MRVGVAERDLVRALARSRASQRRLRWLACALAGLVLALAASAGQVPPDLRLSPAARRALAAPAPAFPVPGDPIYDQALTAFPALQRQPARRHTLAAQLLAAASEHRVDPDLLFAVVAVESSFNPRAVSPRGARGLGQLLFRTARHVAPDRVRRPADLEDPARNLAATARLLRTLLDGRQGDLLRALNAYYAGPFDQHPGAKDRERYFLQVAARYAALKALRAHRALAPSPQPGTQ